MTTLPEDLSSLADAITQDGKPPVDINDSYQDYSIDTALAVYRNNYFGNLIDTLAGAYPVVEQLVGRDFFRMMAHRYIGQHASRSGNLHHYGAEMADFIAAFEPARELPYLPDVAALDWACHCAYFADDIAPLDVTMLGSVAQEHYAGLKLHLHPACQLIASRFPVARIWQAHQPGAPEDFHIDLDAGPCHALVSRREDAVQVEELTLANASWLHYILAGMPLGAATTTTLELHGDLDLQAMMLRLSAQGLLTGFSVEEPA